MDVASRPSRSPEPDRLARDAHDRRLVRRDRVRAVRDWRPRRRSPPPPSTHRSLRSSRNVQAERNPVVDRQPGHPSGVRPNPPAGPRRPPRGRSDPCPMPPTSAPGARPIPSTATARTASATNDVDGNGRGDRSAEYRRRPSRAIPGVPGLHLGHRLFEEARRIVGQRRTTPDHAPRPAPRRPPVGGDPGPPGGTRPGGGDPPLRRPGAHVRPGHSPAHRRRVTAVPGLRRSGRSRPTAGRCSGR